MKWMQESQERAAEYMDATDTSTVGVARFAFHVTGTLMRFSMWTMDTLASHGHPRLACHMAQLVLLPITNVSHRVAMYLDSFYRERK